MSIFNKKLIAVAAGLALSSVPALASHIAGVTFSPETFVVNPTAVGEAYGPFNAGSITFDYRGLINQTGSGFVENGTARFASFFTAVGGSPIGAGTTGLNLGPGTTGYSLYATFSGTGTTAVNGAGGIDGTFSTFNVSFFVDPNNNTTFNAPGSQLPPAPLPVFTDDILVLTGTLEVGGFHVFSGLAAGDFDVQFDVTSTPTGFFSTTIDGDPLSRGDFNGVNSVIIGVAPPPANFTNGEIDGSGNVTLQSVPEPASLSLIGIALLGGALARRKARA
jgi:hypothetical protein